ncbi:hypothetical protein CEXT_129101 [Caerostris extrusa]|uniref:Ycf15 n=1 Tax=Caerostris extrusa TaxID=172846 RepID=A0AAV4XWZ3_CAEEX|nr:hypothetical protein CEXT_129101 [Caerostris extrusa]
MNHMYEIWDEYQLRLYYRFNWAGREGLRNCPHDSSTVVSQADPSHLFEAKRSYLGQWHLQIGFIILRRTLRRLL